MSITSELERAVGYVAEAMLEIFSPNHDNYPTIGIQPFEGEPFSEYYRD